MLQEIKKLIEVWEKQADRIDIGARGCQNEMAQQGGFVASQTLFACADQLKIILKNNGGLK